MLNQVRREGLSLQDKSYNDLEDLNITMTEEENVGQKTLFQLGSRPFKVYMLSKSQMNVLVKFKHENRVIRASF